MKWSEFFSMGGYAFYVLGSYAAALVLMGGEVVQLLRRKKTLAAQRAQSPQGEKYEDKA